MIEQPIHLIDASRARQQQDHGGVEVAAARAHEQAESGDVFVVDIVGNVVSERGRATAEAAVVAPDGSVAAVSASNDDAVLIFDVTGAGDPVLVSTLSNLGFTEHMALVERGIHAGRVFVPTLDGDGSFIHTIDIGGGAGVLGASFALGDGIKDIPGTLAIKP